MLSRRSLFVLPVALPAMAVTAVAAPSDARTVTVAVDAGPLNEVLRRFRLLDALHPPPPETFRELWAGRYPSIGSLARTLGIPFEEPPIFTADEVAETLGIEAPREGAA